MLARSTNEQRRKNSPSQQQYCPRAAQMWRKEAAVSAIDVVFWKDDLTTLLLAPNDLPHPRADNDVGRLVLASQELRSTDGDGVHGLGRRGWADDQRTRARCTLIKYVRTRLLSARIPDASFLSQVTRAVMHVHVLTPLPAPLNHKPPPTHLFQTTSNPRRHTQQLCTNHIKIGEPSKARCVL